MLKKKRIIIIVAICLAVAVVVGTVFGVRAYNDYITQQQIEERIKSIDDTYADFQAESDRTKKLEILSEFIESKPSTPDEISVEVLNFVEPNYDEIIKKMQKFFTDDYDKVIKDNTISGDSLQEMNDKTQIQDYIDKLNSLEAIIESEKSTVFYENNENDAYSYVEKTDDLIDTYSDRIKAIEKAEAEKKEAEEKKKQEESSQSNNNINNGNADADDDYSSDGSNSYNGTVDNNNYYEGNTDSYSDGNSSGGAVDNSGSGSGSSYDSNNENYKWWSWTDEETGKTTYHDSNGNHWDDDGNTWTDGGWGMEHHN